MTEPGSTSTWNPERRFPWLGDSLPCPTPEEEQALAEGGPSGQVRANRRVAVAPSASARAAATPEEEAAEESAPAEVTASSPVGSAAGLNPRVSGAEKDTA